MLSELEFRSPELEANSLGALGEARLVRGPLDVGVRRELRVGQVPAPPREAG